jgi:hypothetical protein
MECPEDIIKRLRQVSFEPLKSVCPTRSDIPHDTAQCAQCSCEVYQLIKAAAAPSGHDDMNQLANACGPIFSLDTTFDGLNTKAVVDFLQLCKDAPEQVDFKTCEPVEVNAMSGPTDNLNADAMLSFLSTNLSGVTGREMIELLDIAQGIDLANDEQGLVSDVAETIAFIEDFARQINLGDAVVPQAMNDSSVLCPGFTSPGSCETFEELRMICPWSCERQKDECAYASIQTCQQSVFQEACPVTCRQIQVLSADLDAMTLEGAIQISTLTDGSAIKANNLKGTVEEECMCFNIFQPVCNTETGEMYANLCEAECRGEQINAVPCKEESMENVVAFAAQSKASEEDLTYIAGTSSLSECGKDCPEVYDPVCSTSAVYENNCHAECDFIYDAKPCADHTGRLASEMAEGDDGRSAVSTSSAVSAVALNSVLLVASLFATIRVL